MYRIAKQGDRASKDVRKIRIIKVAHGKALTGDGDILRRWQEYFEKSMNEVNHKENRLFSGTLKKLPRKKQEML